MNVLPEPERRILELHDLNGMGFAAIVAELHLPSEDAVRMRRRRALGRLSRVLGKWQELLAT